ncbi:MAG: MFS transporter [Clostridiales bacterium]|nr:MFS transporter [Clostridiales bacterium]
METNRDASKGVATHADGQLLNRYFLSILIMAFFFDMCIRFFSSTIALHVDMLGGTATLGGLMLTSYTLTAAIFRVVGGKMSDSYGRRMTILIGVAGLAVTSALFAFTTNVYIMLFLRALQGLFFALGASGFAVAVTDVIPKNRMTEGLGYFGLANSLATAVGPMIALYIMDLFGFNPVTYLAAILCAISWLITHLVCNYERDPRYSRSAVDEQEAGQPDDLPESSNPADSRKDDKAEGFLWRIFEKKAVPSGITGFFAVLANSSTMSFIALYAKHLGYGNAGVYFMLQSAGTIASRLLAGKVADKRGPLFTIIPGVVLGVLGYGSLVIAEYDMPFFFNLSGPLIGLAMGLLFPVMSAMSVRGVSAQRRGAALATFHTPIEVGVATGSLLWGALIDHVSFAAVFIGATLSLGIVAATSVYFFNNKRLSSL